MAYSVKELLDAARARLKVAFEQVDTDGEDPVLAPVNVVRTAEDEALSVQVSGSIPLLGQDGENPTSDENATPFRLASSRVEKVIYNAGNPLPQFFTGDSAYSSDFHEPRSAKSYHATIPHAHIGAFELALCIYTNVDASLTDVRIRGRMFTGDNSMRYTPDLVTPFDLPESGHSSGDRAVIALSDGASRIDTDQNRYYQLVIPELRLPLDAFAISYTVGSGDVPTEGEVVVSVTRRY